MAIGQRLGPKAVYLYTADDGNVYTIRRDTTLGDIQGCGLTRATSTTPNNGRLPVGLSPRGVHWQGESGGIRYRKFLICNPQGALYLANASQNLPIDGDPGATTGRRGETATFDAVPSGEVT
jgi:hypothetical protein